MQLKDITRLAALALLLFAGCSQESCPCPLGGAQIMLSADLAAQLAGVSTKAPCTASDMGSGWIFVMRSSAGTCDVHLTLKSGAVYESSVAFHSLGGCCSDTYNGAASAVQLVDAGSD